MSTEFTCDTTKCKYSIRVFLTCNTKNMIYLIACKCCSKQYLGCPTYFKKRFRIHRNDINTGKIRCGVASHLLNVCKSATCKTKNMQIQLIEDVDEVLWEREKILGNPTLYFNTWIK